jgi:glyoxylase-like metal-dependent hydrolase (beta-lactamase superfamily II)
MAIHIMDCAPMSPWFPRWHVGGACLVVETEDGPVLVDTGLGLHDYLSPNLKTRFFLLIFNVSDGPAKTAVRQIKQLGFQPDEVRHIVMTHLHFDHAGGLPDFPDAQVHVHKAEIEAMRHPRTWIEQAYDPADFAHGPRWVPYETIDSEWFGFEAIRLPFTPEMFLIPLFGHTHGHCGVAIRHGAGWVLHAADALPLNAEFDLTPAWLNKLVLGPHIPRLRALATAHPEVRMLAGHFWQDSFGAGGRIN